MHLFLKLRSAYFSSLGEHERRTPFLKNYGFFPKKVAPVLVPLICYVCTVYFISKVGTYWRKTERMVGLICFECLILDSSCLIPSRKWQPSPTPLLLPLYLASEYYVRNSLDSEGVLLACKSAHHRGNRCEPNTPPAQAKQCTLPYHWHHGVEKSGAFGANLSRQIEAIFEYNLTSQSGRRVSLAGKKWCSQSHDTVGAESLICRTEKIAFSNQNNFGHRQHTVETKEFLLWKEGPQG